MPSILVLAEHRQGILRDITWEMMALASTLSQGEEVKVLLLGHQVEKMAEEMVPYGVKVLLVKDPLLSEYNGVLYQQVLSTLLDNCSPDLVLIGHTTQGIDFSPRLAVEKDLPFLSDVIALAYGEEGLEATRDIYGGKVRAVFLVREEKTSIITVREGHFPCPSPASCKEVEVLELPPLQAVTARVFQGFVAAEKGDIDIAQSQVLISVGRGLKEEKNLPLMEELAENLGGHVSGSRPAVDEGWLPRDRQVGTSGKSVKPTVYLAFGISGSFQHTAGIKGAEKIIAVNTDQDAPIFNVADYGIVEDLQRFVPVVMKELKNR